MFDTVIANGRLVRPDGTREGSIGIRDGAIAAIVEPGEVLPGRVIFDAAGQIVLPGLVDAHVHLREPGLVHKEGFASGTRAAAAGGVTTVMVMPTDDPWTATPEQFEEKRALAEGQCHVDFALQAAIGPKSGDLARLADAGAISFELFLAGGMPDFLVTEDGDLIDLLRRARATGTVVGITAGAPGLIAALTETAKRKDQPTIRSFASVRPPVTEALGVARAIVAAEEAGARIHFRQISCAASVQLIARLAGGLRITSEVTPHNLLLTDEDAERLGPYGAVIPPLRPVLENTALVAALRDGVIDMVATDHAPHLPSEKDRGLHDIWRAASGLPGVQTFCLVMLDLVARQALTFDDVARTCAEAPAKRFGLYPRKGAIALGADADLILIDPAAETVISNEAQLSKAAVTPFAGRVVRGAIDLVLLRGRTIARAGRVEGEPHGHFLRPHRY